MMATTVMLIVVGVPGAKLNIKIQEWHPISCLIIAVLLIGAIKKIVAYKKLLKIISHWLTTNKLWHLTTEFYCIPMGRCTLH